MNAKDNTHIMVLGGVITFAVAVVIVAVGVIVNSVFGNPISKAIAKNNVEDYLSTVYDESTVGSGSYNLIREMYMFDCTVDGVDKIFSYSDGKVTEEYTDRY